MRPNLDVILTGQYSFKIVSGTSSTSKMATIVSDSLRNGKSLKFFRTNGWNEVRFGPNSPWIVPFQNCVRQPLQLFKMAAMADYATVGFPRTS